MLRKGFEKILRTANGGEFVYAYIEEENEPSKALHKSLGFEDTGELRPFSRFMFADEETTRIKKTDMKVRNKRCMFFRKDCTRISA